jgi:VWFA-related protein
MKRPLRGLAAALVFATALVSAQQPVPPPPPPQQPQSGSFRFKSGVELINVTVTVTDASGRFVPSLRQDDFVVYEDDERQSVTHFSADRVPVSLGILLDTSQSMQGEKFDAARAAIDRFLSDLTSQDDEFFLMQFSSTPNLLQGWTDDRRLVSRALAGAFPRGGTAMYDAIADALPMMKRARNRKQAIVILSDGNDMTSDTPLSAVHQIIRQSEALVYAVGIDCSGVATPRRPFMELQRLAAVRGRQPRRCIHRVARSTAAAIQSTCGRYAILPTTAADAPSWCAIRATSTQPLPRSPMS